MQYDYMIYPKQFRSARIPVQNNYCFFLMPFNERFDIVYGAIKDSLMKCNYVCNRVDEISGSKPIITKILVEIIRAQYVIVDLTDCNPNVFYELGIAHTFKDSRNVLLLKQRNSKVPFDITHLQYREYDPNNLKQLTSIIRTFISSNQQFNDFYEALHLRGVISSSSETDDSLVEYLQAAIKDDMTTITKILNYQCDEIGEIEIENVLNRYQMLIHKAIDDRRFDIMSGMLALYSELIVACSAYNVTIAHAAGFLGDFFSQHNMTGVMIQEYKTTMALSIAERNKLNPIVLPWIINYFTQSKSATIDLNRYRLEAFLMTSNYEAVDKAIISSMVSNDCHIREHMADIIGEKHLVAAGEVLLRQLIAEENYYSATSIIEAIGKLGLSDGIETINKWLNNHKSDIINTKMFSVLRHAKNAIIRMDNTPNHAFYKEFMSLYGDYIDLSVPL